MIAIRTRLARRAGDDAGLSIVEVVIAMFIFALVSSGAIYSMLTVLQVTRDSRSQQVAANLAAQDIDLARDFKDLFKLLPTTYDVPLNGDVFTVTRQAEWVSSSGNDVKCGSGGGELSYKRVNVSVTWGNMRTGSAAVRADTLIDPNSRITDPTRGTILVFVKKEGGVGSQGVTITATADSVLPNGAVTPSPNTAVTDEAGCAYILKVKPGNYDITLTHTPATYVSEKQESAPILKLGVQANATSSKGAQYDDAGRFDVIYAANYVSQTRPLIPTDLETNFWNTYGRWRQLPVAGNEFLLHPFGGGYQAITGDESKCAAVDPANWTPNAFGPPPAVPTVAVAAGAQKDVPIGMGVVKITKSNSSGSARFLRAVSVNAPGGGNPGCVTQLDYDFGKVIPSNQGSIMVALPYGTWQLSSDSSGGLVGVIVGNLLTPSSGNTTISGVSGATVVGNTVTVDPRPTS